MLISILRNSSLVTGTLAQHNFNMCLSKFNSKRCGAKQYRIYYRRNIWGQSANLPCFPTRQLLVSLLVWKLFQKESKLKIYDEFIAKTLWMQAPFRVHCVCVHHVHGQHGLILQTMIHEYSVQQTSVAIASNSNDDVSSYKPPPMYSSTYTRYFKVCHSPP